MKKALLILLSFSLISCAQQKATLPNGSIVENNQLLSKGGMSMSQDGTFFAFADSSEAAKDIGKFGEAVLRASLIRAAIGATAEVAGQVTEVVGEAAQ
jgi:hypothetical protein